MTGEKDQGLYHGNRCVRTFIVVQRVTEWQPVTPLLDKVLRVRMLICYAWKLDRKRGLVGMEHPSRLRNIQVLPNLNVFQFGAQLDELHANNMRK